MTALRSLYLADAVLEGLVLRLQEYGHAVTLDQVRDVGRLGAPAAHAVNRAARGDEEIEEAAWEVIEELVGGDFTGGAAA